MKYSVIALLVLLVSTVSYGEEIDALYLDLEDNGVVIINKEPCSIEQASKLGLLNRAVGIEGNGTKHEGCWNSPDIRDAQPVPGSKIIPIVNLYFEGEVVKTFPLEWFRLEKSHNNPSPGEEWL